MGRVDALLCQSHGHAPDLLDRPADQSTGRRALVFVFGGGSWFAWWRKAAIMAKTELGLAHNETRSWHGWHRHVSLVMLALAMMAAVRHHANQLPPPKTKTRARRPVL